MSKLVEEQRKICQRYAADYMATERLQKLGMARGVDRVFPINGLRHVPANGTSGWYIWAGTEMSDSADFFLPLHTFHLSEIYPSIQKYLGLASGWRFLLVENYEDVWFDPELLNIV